MIRNRSNVLSQEWSPSHFAWSLTDRNEVSIKVEEIPVAGHSDAHYHKESRQFFFILEGRAKVDLTEGGYMLKKFDGIEISTESMHQISNIGEEKLLFLLISWPKVQEHDVHKSN